LPKASKQHKEYVFCLCDDAMRTNQSSATAEFMALFRAQESGRPERERLFSDPLAASLLGPQLRAVCFLLRVPLLGRLLVRFIDARWPGARTSGIARTRLIDDWVSDAVAAGAQQALFLGAGLDSRAWRLAAVSDLPIFEVDHPATSAEKRRRLQKIGASTSRVAFVAVDFDREQLSDALLKAGFRFEKRTIAVWEGVTNYLTAQAVDATLRWIGALGRESRLIFTYVHADVLGGSGRFKDASRPLLAVANAGEPWTFGLKPEALPFYLQECGLRLIEDLGANDYRARTMGSLGASLRGYEFYHVALAEVVDRSCRD
jgi:methyltransferase (TIGR00027 family)